VENLTHEKRRGDGKTRLMVLKLAQENFGIRAIADACEVSTQAVHYHLKKLRAEGLLSEEDE
jgi:predicted transcriptional regulator